MKKLYFALLFITVSAPAILKAQVWAPNIGTYWYYDRPHSPNGCNGYAKYDYYKDSLINGNNCQMIRRYSENSCINGNHAGYGRPIFTYTNSNKVVYVNDYTASTSVQTQTFDTLFWFNAPIGAKWQMLHQSINCTYSVVCVVTVQDTGHRVIQGNSLKWQKVSYLSTNTGPSGQPTTDTIYERFGYLKTDPYNYANFCYVGIDVQTSSVFRCYGDNQITNLKYQYTGNCDYYYTSINEKSKEDDLSVFPNPAGSYLVINATGSQWQDARIELQDAFGRIVLNESFTKRLDVSSLVPGVYVVSVKNATEWRSFKIMKQ